MTRTFNLRAGLLSRGYLVKQAKESADACGLRITKLEERRHLLSSQITLTVSGALEDVDRFHGWVISETTSVADVPMQAG